MEYAGSTRPWGGCRRSSILRTPTLVSSLHLETRICLQIRISQFKEEKMGSKITGPICDPNWEKCQLIFFDDKGKKQRTIGKPSEIARLWNQLHKEGKANHILCAGEYPPSKLTKNQKMLVDAHRKRWEQDRREFKKRLRAREATK